MNGCPVSVRPDESRRPPGRLRFLALLPGCLSLLALTACGPSAVDKALDSDANGYLCVSCKARFYTDRDVFASFCPKCKQPDIEQVLGFVCSKDNHVTLGARSRGARVCEKCGGATSSVCIPQESHLKAWGAPKKTREEVGAG